MSLRFATCNCPVGMRYHAFNCPSAPGELQDIPAWAMPNYRKREGRTVTPDPFDTVRAALPPSDETAMYVAHVRPSEALSALAGIEDRLEDAYDEIDGLRRQSADASTEAGKWRKRAERERDELREALREALDIIVWMSGADDFSPDGKAQEGWVKARDQLDRLFLLARPASGEDKP